MRQAWRVSMCAVDTFPSLLILFLTNHDPPFLYLYQCLYLLLIYPSCCATAVCHRKGRLCSVDPAVFTGKVKASWAHRPSVKFFVQATWVDINSWPLSIFLIFHPVPQVSWSQPQLRRLSKPTTHRTFCSQLPGRFRPVRHRLTMMTAT